MKRKLFIGVMALVLVLTLSGCGSNTEPIHQEVGWYEWITVVPLGYVLQFFAGFFSNSFAMGILITTIIVRTVAWPIYAKTNDFTLKMNLVQPEMQKIQAKYATKRDPESQQKMQMETMALYKKYGVNPLGCLVIFFQMPIFMAMYSTVVRIAIPVLVNDDGTKKVSMFFGGEEFTLNRMLGAIDLSQGCAWTNWSLILPLLVGISMAGLQYLSTKKPKNTPKPVTTSQADQTAKMMKITSYAMVGMMVFWSFDNAALAFYWVVGNIYSIGQNLLNRYLNARKLERMKQQFL